MKITDKDLCSHRTYILAGRNEKNIIIFFYNIILLYNIMFIYDSVYFIYANLIIYYKVNDATKERSS